MTDQDEALGRLLTDHLPPVPPGVGTPPPAGALRARARARARRRIAVAGSAVAVVSAVAAGLAGAAALRGGDVPVTAATSPTATPPAAPVSRRAGPTPPPGARVTNVPVGNVALGTDGRTLTVQYAHGSCEQAALTYRQGERSVLLELGMWRPHPEAGCRADLRTATFVVRLDQPLGTRTAIDSSTGAEVVVHRLADLLKPGYRPPGCTRIQLTSGGRTGCHGGGYAMEVSQQQPGTPASPDGGGQPTPLGDRQVRGTTAALAVERDGPKIDPTTGKPYTNPDTGQPYEAILTITLTWQEKGYRFVVSVGQSSESPYQHHDQADLVEQAVRVAEGLR